MKNAILAVLALALFVGGCRSRNDTSALLAQVSLDAQLKASCVQVQVLDSEGNPARDPVKLVRTPGTHAFEGDHLTRGHVTGHDARAEGGQHVVVQTADL